MTKAQWDETLKTLLEQGVLKTALPADDVFTDKFLAGG
jgi:NitT/TauT family transport system substrate-binding protein